MMPLWQRIDIPSPSQCRADALGVIRTWVKMNIKFTYGPDSLGRKLPIHLKTTALSGTTTLTGNYHSIWKLPLYM